MDAHSVIDTLLEVAAINSGVVKVNLIDRVTRDQIAQWEHMHRHELPADYKEFLGEVGSCSFHGRPDLDYTYAVKCLPLSEIQPFAVTAYGESIPEIPLGWYAIADIHEGNFIILDLDSVRNATANIIDGFSLMAHVEAPIIAISFTEFLKRSLDDPDASSGSGSADGTRRYWSHGAPTYGDAHDKA